MLTTLRRVAAIIAATAIATVGAASPASAAGPWTATFAAGEACSFPLTVSGSGDLPKVYREFLDRDGKVRAILSAGKGQDLTYTNATTAKTFSTRANGAVSWTVRYADGSKTLRLLGHNVVFLFPTDVGGPSATLYTGQVVITVDAAEVWRVVKETGMKLDICARLT